MRKILLALAAVLLFAVGSNPASAMLIDNFNNGGGYVTAAENQSDSVIVGPINDVVGQYRQLELPNSKDIHGSGAARMEANPSNAGYLSFSLDAMTTGSGLLTWDANGAGLGGVDMTDGGLSSYVSFDILAIDQGDVDLSVIVEDIDGTTGRYTLSGAGVGTYQFNFLSFTNATDIDFADIDSIKLDIIANGAASDLVLDQIFSGGHISVPAPRSTLILMALGLLLLGFGLRRRAQ